MTEFTEEFAQADGEDSRIKETVRARYGGIATGLGSCCGPTESRTGAGAGAASEETFSMITELYSPLKGYEPDADLGLGCGLPTRYADLQTGETVIDLGSGAGNDAFVAAAEVGTEGRVIGLDMTPEMVERARELAVRRGATNVEFVLGEIENMPIEDEVADCLLSNCVLNLVPNKAAAFRESFRVLKPGGRFAVSDIVIEGDLPPQLRHSAEMYVGCVAGAMQREAYLSVIHDAGFVDIRVAAEKTIHLPDSVLSSALTPEEMSNFRSSGARIVSVTVNASRPGLSAQSVRR
jgi:arsenite methyltransferase